GSTGPAAARAPRHKVLLKGEDEEPDLASGGKEQADERQQTTQRRHEQSQAAEQDPGGSEQNQQGDEVADTRNEIAAERFAARLRVFNLLEAGPPARGPRRRGGGAHPE